MKIEKLSKLKALYDDKKMVQFISQIKIYCKKHINKGGNLNAFIEIVNESLGGEVVGVLSKSLSDKGKYELYFQQLELSNITTPIVVKEPKYSASSIVMASHIVNGKNAYTSRQEWQPLQDKFKKHLIGKESLYRKNKDVDLDLKTRTQYESDLIAAKILVSNW